MPKTTGREKTHPNENAFPVGLSGPALRALAHAGISSMQALTRYTRADLAAMHGMGPKGIQMLEEALAGSGHALRSGG